MPSYDAVANEDAAASGHPKPPPTCTVVTPADSTLSRQRQFTPKASRNQNLATLGVDDVLGEGDSRLVLEVLPNDLAEVAFERMREEVKWDTMYHRGM